MVFTIRQLCRLLLSLCRQARSYYCFSSYSSSLSSHVASLLLLNQLSPNITLISILNARLLPLRIYFPLFLLSAAMLVSFLIVIGFKIVIVAIYCWCNLIALFHTLHMIKACCCDYLYVVIDFRSRPTLMATKSCKICFFIRLNSCFIVIDSYVRTCVSKVMGGLLIIMLA